MLAESPTSSINLQSSLDSKIGQIHIDLIPALSRPVDKYVLTQRTIRSNAIRAHTIHSPLSHYEEIRPAGRRLVAVTICSPSSQASMNYTGIIVVSAR